MRAVGDRADQCAGVSTTVNLRDSANGASHSYRLGHGSRQFNRASSIGLAVTSQVGMPRSWKLRISASALAGTEVLAPVHSLRLATKMSS